jgi:tetratricopeptide (TPR) repeat protein
MASGKPYDDAQVKKEIATPSRVDQVFSGQITWQEFYGLSDEELGEMARIGFTMYEQGQYNKARAIFEGLRELDRTESYYSTALGALHLAEGALDEAVKETSHAIQINPKDLAAYVNRGEAYLRKAQPVEAAKDFAKALSLDPQGQDPLTRRARALAAATLRSVGVTEDELGVSGPVAKPTTPKPVPGKPGVKPAAKPVPKR